VTRLLWTLQVLLAAMFLLSGAIKLAVPPDVLYLMVPLPEAFVRFIGCCEALGALGLILPSLLRIRPELTPLAAAGLTIIMIGATVLTPVFEGTFVTALLPLALGVVAAFIGYGRWRLAPIRRAPSLHLATR
jgi:hypothetical protein